MNVRFCWRYEPTPPPPSCPPPNDSPESLHSNPQPTPCPTGPPSAQIADHAKEPRLVKAVRDPPAMCRDQGACILDTASPQFWGHYDANRLLASLDVPEVAFMACNGTDEHPQFANPWAYRNLPYTGYKPAYIMHHGHWEYVRNLQHFAATPDMSQARLQQIFLQHRKVHNLRRWPLGMDWPYKNYRLDVHMQPHWRRAPDGNVTTRQPEYLKVWASGRGCI